MPMKYDENTGMPRFVPDTAIEIGEGTTPEPVFTKEGVFKGDPPPGLKKPVTHSGGMSIDDEVAKLAAGAKPGDLDRRYASDEEVEEIRQLATTHHWPSLIGLINRLRKAEGK